jgi:hypothetical protein
MKIKFLNIAKKELSRLNKNSQILIKEKLLILAENEEKTFKQYKTFKRKIQRQILFKSRRLQNNKYMKKRKRIYYFDNQNST